MTKMTTNPKPTAATDLLRKTITHLENLSLTDLERILRKVASGASPGPALATAPLPRRGAEAGGRQETLLTR